MDRLALEKFYTPDTLILQTITHIPRATHFVEPSAGAGAFLPYLKHRVYPGGSVTSYDLLPEHTDVIESSWFDVTSIPKNSVVVGNPPYTLAVKFINHAFALGASKVCFILPPSFKKKSIQRRIHKFAHLDLEIDLKDAEFTVGDATIEVPSIFQIWTIKPIPRAETRDVIEPDGWCFVKDRRIADISVRRVGVKCGYFQEVKDHLSQQSNLFIKFDKAVPNIIIERLVNEGVPVTDFSKIKSISKQEITEYVNQTVLDLYFQS